MHPPNLCMPVWHTAHMLVIGDLHVLQTTDTEMIPCILYPWHLLHLSNPLVVVLFVTVGHEHSMQNIALAVLQSGRPVPQWYTMLHQCSQNFAVGAVDSELYCLSDSIC